MLFCQNLIKKNKIYKNMLKLNYFTFFNIQVLNYYLSSLKYLHFLYFNFLFFYYKKINFIFDTKISYFSKLLYLKKNNSILCRQYNYISEYKNLALTKNTIKKKININSTSLLSSSAPRYISIFGKKKFKKVIYFNRKIYKALDHNIIKTSYMLKKLISFRSKQSNLSRFLNYNFKLFNILIISGFFKNFEDLLILCKNNQIFINRRRVNFKNITLRAGDFIECTINKLYKIYSYSIKAIQIKSLYKIKNKAWKKSKTNNFTSLTALDFVNINLSKKNNINQYFEIDYFTLTIILLYKNFDYNSTSLLNYKLISLYLYKLYNWI